MTEFRHLWLIPAITAALGVLAFLLPYTIAVALNHINLWLSFISDGGARMPEAGIFSLLLNLLAFCVLITFIVRHMQIVAFYDKHSVSPGWIKAMSWVALVLGILIAIGLALVANFPESQELNVHDIGARMAFIIGCAYFWLQVLIGYLAKPRMPPSWVVHLRLLLCLFITASVAIHLVVQIAKPFVREVNGVKPKQEQHPPFGISRVNSESPFYTNHMVSTISEWCLATGFMLFLLTYAVDMKNFVLTRPTLFFELNIPPSPPRRTNLADGRRKIQVLP